jgi:hypothetical protein
MKRTLLIALLLFLVAGVLFTLSISLRLRSGMTRLEIETRMKPSRFAAGSALFYNDRLGVYMGRRNFLLATQYVTIRLGSNNTATNVTTRWTWRTGL